MRKMYIIRSYETCQFFAGQYRVNGAWCPLWRFACLVVRFGIILDWSLGVEPPNGKCSARGVCV